MASPVPRVSIEDSPPSLGQLAIPLQYPKIRREGLFLRGPRRAPARGLSRAPQSRTSLSAEGSPIIRPNIAGAARRLFADKIVRFPCHRIFHGASLALQVNAVERWEPWGFVIRTAPAVPVGFPRRRVHGDVEAQARAGEVDDCG